MRKLKPRRVPETKSKREFSSKLKKGIRKNRESIWDYKRDGLTFSSLSRWLEDREQFVLSVMDGWTPKKPSIPLEFGSIFHRCLENSSLSSSPEIVAEKITSDYLSSRKSPRTAEDRDTIHRIIAMIKIIYPLYCQYWDKQDKSFKWMEREKKFKITHHLVRYPMNVDGDKIESLPAYSVPVVLQGMRDGVVRSSNEMFLFETKTRFLIDLQTIQQSLKNDMQTMLYCYSLLIDYHETPSGVIYNIVRRPSQQFTKSDTMSSFTNKIRNDIMKRPEHYFIRLKITITEDDLNNFIERTLDPALRNFSDWHDSLRGDHTNRWSSPLHFVNPNALVNKFGKCDLFDLMVKGTTFPYYRRDCPFPELAE